MLCLPSANAGCFHKASHYERDKTPAHQSDQQKCNHFNKASRLERIETENMIRKDIVYDASTRPLTTRGWSPPLKATLSILAALPRSLSVREEIDALASALREWKKSFHAASRLERIETYDPGFGYWLYGGLPRGLSVRED